MNQGDCTDKFRNLGARALKSCLLHLREPRCLQPMDPGSCQSPVLADRFVLVCLAKASHCLTETRMSMLGPNSVEQSQTSRSVQSQLSAVCPNEGMDTQGDRGSWLG